MIGMWLIARTSLAGVVVDDPSGCLDPERIDLEVRAALGDGQVDDIQLVVHLDVEDTAGDLPPPWSLHLEVRAHRGVLWQRDLEVEEFDCPYVPALVARSAEQGIAGVPRWQLGMAPRSRPPELGFRLGATLPPPVHVDLGGQLGVRVGGPILWFAHTDMFGTAVNPVGEGGGQIFGILVGSGLGIDLNLGSAGSVRVTTEIGAGPATAIGRQFLANDAVLVPRAVARLELGFVPRGAFRISSRLQIPAVRLALRDDGSGGTFIEPWIRVGLVLGLAGDLGRGPEADRRTDLGFDAVP